jgi:RNA polymerase sigma-70 factor (TIGR02957 family)
MSADPFIVHRSLLFTVAYEMLGSATDAEDVVQETWLRWAGVDHSSVDDPRAYLVRIVTRQALNLLRTLSRRREDYVGEWLPEPLATSPDVANDIELAESVSIAMLIVLETLDPTERAVFVLREVFDTPYQEIAEAVSKTPAAVRQIAHRARKHVAARRPRMQVDPEMQERVLDRFMEAARTGETRALLDVLAPDVVMVADGGGVAAALPRPIIGAQKVAAAMRGFRRYAPRSSIRAIQINGAPALLVEIPGEAPTVVTATVAGGVITRIFAMRNPHKLARIARETALSR